MVWVQDPLVHIPFALSLCPPSSRLVPDERNPGGKVRQGEEFFAICHKAMAQDGAFPARCSTKLVSDVELRVAVYFMFLNAMLMSELQSNRCNNHIHGPVVE